MKPPACPANRKAQRDPVSAFAVPERDPTAVDQALRDDPPALPGVPLGVLIIGAFGWLISAIAIVVLPWPMPGAQPTIFGALLRRLVVTIPDEDAFSALTRHVLDLLPFVALVLIPIFLVLASGRRQSRSAVGGLAIIGTLGMLYSLSMALYVGGSCAVIGFVVVLTSGIIGSSAWTRGSFNGRRSATTENVIGMQSVPEVNPTIDTGVSFESENAEQKPELNSEIGTGDDHDLYSAS